MLIFSRLSDKKLQSKIIPLLSTDTINEIYLIRKTPLKHDRIINYNPKIRLFQLPILFDLWRLYLGIIILNKKKNTPFIMGIYTIPHGLIALILAKIFKKKLIINLIGSEFIGALKKKLSLYIAKNAQGIITRGKESENFLFSQGIRNTEMLFVHNEIIFPNNPINEIDTPKKFDLIYVGNLVSVKRIDLMIDALFYLKNHFQLQPNLQIVGEGPLLNTLRTKVKELNLEKQIFFQGHSENVTKHLKESKIFLMSSEHEGLPQAMLEAMNQGLPCIMPNLSNIPDYIKHRESGLLFTPLSSLELAECIKLLLEDSDLYSICSKGSKIRFDLEKNHFSRPHIAKEWEKFLAKLS